MEFVEAEDFQLVGQFVDHLLDHVALVQLAVGEDALVDVLHEGVEMDASRLFLLLDGFDEEVHQHRLAAADIAPDVKAASRCDGGFGEAEPAARGGIGDEFIGQLLHGFGSMALGGIGRQLAAGDGGFVTMHDRSCGKLHAAVVAISLAKATRSER